MLLTWLTDDAVQFALKHEDEDSSQSLIGNSKTRRAIFINDGKRKRWDY